MKSRFWFLLIILFSAYSALLVHLYQIQLIHGGYYLARAESQFAVSKFLFSKRGGVYFTDKDGGHLAAALDKNFPLIYAVPKDVGDLPEASNQLSLILGKPSSELEKLLSDRSSGYKLLERKASAEVAEKIDQAKIGGVYIDSVPERFYPLGALTSHVLGFVGPNSGNNGESGKYGLEKIYKQFLSGTENAGGHDLSLSIDPSIQTEAERILDNLIKNYKAGGGSVIVEEPSTGKILTMASYPNFNPNSYSDYGIGSFLNPSIQAVYESGSVMKVVTMSAGIDSGKISPGTAYFDNGYVVVNGKRVENYDLKNHGPYGRATMTNVIEHSINTGAVFAENQIGNQIFRDYLVKFGFGELTGIDLPGELKGNLSKLFGKYVPQINYATASFGQGVAVTQVELINAISAIANGGQLMKPYLNADSGPEVIRRVISSSTARQVADMMVSAVDKAGVAAIDGYSVAGKTGTGQVPDLKNGGYTDRVVDTYVGFAPAGNPRFVALIKIDEPAGAPVAALTVVPAFRDLARFILNYYNIPPDR